MFWAFFSFVRVSCIYVILSPRRGCVRHVWGSLTEGSQEETAFMKCDESTFQWNCCHRTIRRWRHGFGGNGSFSVRFLIGPGPKQNIGKIQTLLQTPHDLPRPFVEWRQTSSTSKSAPFEPGIYGRRMTSWGTH